MIGKCMLVTEQAAGSPLTADASSGATEFTVADVFEFTPQGGKLLVGGEQVDYVSVDRDLNILYLSGPTSFDHFIGDIVAVYPEVLVRIAHVAPPPVPALEGTA